jgi:hypothetical protein
MLFSVMANKKIANDDAESSAPAEQAPTPFVPKWIGAKPMTPKQRLIQSLCSEAMPMHSFFAHQSTDTFRSGMLSLLVKLAQNKASKGALRQMMDAICWGNVSAFRQSLFGNPNPKKSDDFKAPFFESLDSEEILDVDDDMDASLLKSLKS